MSMGVAPSGGTGDDMPPVAEINVTPMVDVMLVLLIIFMVSMPLMMSQLPITLPQESSTPPPVHKDPLIVSIDMNGQYAVDLGGGNVQPLTYDALPGRLAELAKTEGNNLVFVRAENGVLYGKVMDLLSLVGGAGFEKVSLMKQP